MEQEADKAALKEALQVQARLGLNFMPEPEEQVVALRKFIAGKKEAITTRDAELRKASTSKTAATNSTDKQPQFDLRANVENAENARIDAQLHEAQIQLLEPELAKAIELLAAAEHEAGRNEKHRLKADEARKVYDKIKAEYVKHSKELRVHQQQSGGMAVGGMGGMGGGFR
jgi:hypothetical protein